jgi:hypothetical protein
MIPEPTPPSNCPARCRTSDELHDRLHGFLLTEPALAGVECEDATTACASGAANTATLPLGPWHLRLPAAAAATERLTQFCQALCGHLSIAWERLSGLSPASTHTASDDALGSTSNTPQPEQSPNLIHLQRRVPIVK